MEAKEEISFIIDKNQKIVALKRTGYKAAMGLRFTSEESAKTHLGNVAHINNVIAPEFQEKLYALLREYGATISFSVSDCSDTHGLYGDKMVLSIKHDSTRVEDIELARGWGIG